LSRIFFLDARDRTWDDSDMTTDAAPKKLSKAAEKRALLAFLREEEDRRWAIEAARLTAKNARPTATECA